MPASQVAQSNNQGQHKLLSMWEKLGGSPLKRKLFNIILSRTVPYSGSIKADVVELEPGRVQVALNDRRAVRNHLNSIHAIALANLGELSSGLAMITALSTDTRAIVVNLEIEYLKKARGRLLAEGRANPPQDISEAIDSLAVSDITDNEGDVVAQVKVYWRLSPKVDVNKDNA